MNKNDKKSKPSNHWNRETCYEEAKNYKSRRKFHLGSSRAYLVALKNGWLTDYIWFQKKIKWTRETCFKEAKKYKTRSEFCKNSQGAYQVALKNGWLIDYTWFEQIINPKGYWTRERCFEEAKNYKSISEFSRSNNYAYQVALKNGWLIDYTWFEHNTIPDNNIYVVYCYKDNETNSIYVGLTNNINRRHREHCNGFLRHGIKTFDIVNKYFSSRGKEIPEPIILKKNICSQEAQQFEKKYVEQFNKEGLTVLNIAKTGSLGGYTKWTRERCFEEAKNYKSRSEFQRKCNGAYKVAFANNWVNDYLWFNEPYKRNYWNYDTCYNEAKKYKSKVEFKTGSLGAYKVALKNCWLNDYVWFSTPIRKIKWNYDTCYQEAKKYLSRKEFANRNGSAYQVALKNEWLKDYIWFKHQTANQYTKKS